MIWMSKSQKGAGDFLLSPSPLVGEGKGPSPIPRSRPINRHGAGEGGGHYWGNFKYLWIGFPQIRERMIRGFK